MSRLSTHKKTQKNSKTGKVNSALEQFKANKGPLAKKSLGAYQAGLAALQRTLTGVSDAVAAAPTPSEHVYKSADSAGKIANAIVDNSKVGAFFKKFWTDGLDSALLKLGGNIGKVGFWFCWGFVFCFLVWTPHTPLSHQQHPQ